MKRTAEIILTPTGAIACGIAGAKKGAHYGIVCGRCCGTNGAILLGCGSALVGGLFGLATGMEIDRRTEQKNRHDTSSGERQGAPI